MNKIDRSFKNNRDFYIILTIVALAFVLTINTDLAEFSQHKDINIPTYFFYYSLGIDLLAVISLFLIFIYKKIGIILFPLLVLIHFGIHNYFLSTYLYSDITTLFVFVGAGLVAIIPRWKDFK